MAGEVTMKDLQSLQGHCNKKVADVQAQVDKLGKTLEALRTALNIQADEIAKRAHHDKLNEVIKTVNTISASVDQLKKNSS